MPVLAARQQRLPQSFPKQRVEEDLDDEMRSHVELLADEKIRHGMKPQRSGSCGEIGTRRRRTDKGAST